MFRNWGSYVPVAQRRAKGVRWAIAQAKKGVAVSPVVVEGRTIARSFWGKAWCDSLETYSDFSNRLPRGRTYVRNGSVVHLQIERGAVKAQVSGSSLYATSVKVAALQRKLWKQLVDRHATKVSSVVDLLQGRLPKSLLEALAERSSGLFPKPKELEFACSCPDWAEMCKHVAAVLYGVGARLDARPELFFVLRGVEVADLAARGAEVEFAGGGDAAVAGDLGEIFGIELVSRGAGRREAGRKPRGGRVERAKRRR